MLRNFFVVFFIFSTMSALAQSSLPKGNRIPSKGSVFANVGIGVSSWGVPIYAGAELMVHKEVSIGGQASFQSQSETYSGITYRHNAISVAGRANYYFNTLLEISAPYLFYAGATLGFASVSTTHTGTGIDYKGSRGSGLFFGVQTGGSYFFTKDWAANAEIGIGNVFGLKLGATYLF